MDVTRPSTFQGLIQISLNVYSRLTIDDTENKRTAIAVIAVGILAENGREVAKAPPRIMLVLDFSPSWLVRADEGDLGVAGHRKKLCESVRKTTLMAKTVADHQHLERRVLACAPWNYHDFHRIAGKCLA